MGSTKIQPAKIMLSCFARITPDILETFKRNHRSFTRLTWATPAPQSIRSITYPSGNEQSLRCTAERWPLQSCLAACGGRPRPTLTWRVYQLKGCLSGKRARLTGHQTNVFLEFPGQEKREGPYDNHRNIGCPDTLQTLPSLGDTGGISSEQRLSTHVSTKQINL